jgi:hypothetical protein
MRMTMADAYDGLAANPNVPKTETGKRDFINQSLGQYNAKMQNGLIALARATGLGPFATAGSTMTARSIRMLFGGSGIKADTYKTAARLRAESLARLYGLIGIGMAVNFLAWKRWDGDETVPFGAIKVGERDGKSVYIDTPASLIVRRGLRSVGALAALEGKRQGTPAGTTFDRGAKDVVKAVFHPLTGPLFQFAYELVTGEDMIGKPVSPRVTTAKTDQGVEKAVDRGMLPPGSSQMVANAKGAVTHMNPVIEALFGGDPNPAKQPSRFERFMKLLGPFGAKTARPRKE